MQALWLMQNPDAARSLKTLSDARALTEHLLRIEPDNIYLRSTLGLLLIRMSRQEQALQQAQGTLELATRGVVILKAIGKEQNAHGVDLDAVATGLTIVKPERLRDPQLAVECAERMVDMSHHQKPGYLFTLARTYRAACQPEHARTAAKEGLALLPLASPAAAPFRIRKQLQAELASNRPAPEVRIFAHTSNEVRASH